MPWLVAAEEGVAIGSFELAEAVARAIEVAAIISITIAIIAALVGAVIARIESDWNTAFSTFKRNMARGMLIGLDLVIAADIIKTVTQEPTIENTATLGLLVLIRTFLSWSIVLEVTGQWPWQGKAGESSEAL
jgi:uncharacterized membrane protein